MINVLQLSSSLENADDSGLHGVVHALGVQTKSDQWSNPSMNGKMIISTSGMKNEFSAGPQAVIGRQSVRCLTDEQQNAWVIVGTYP